MSETKRSSCLVRLFKAGFFLAGAAAGAVAAANAVIAWNTPPLGGRLGGGFNRYPARYGDMAYSVAGSGTPLVFLHALRPGNSSAEWEDNFEAFARDYTVYAPDFLGWGLSDKPSHIFTADDYAEQVLHFVQDIAGDSASKPVAVIASGEACTFALMAADQAPELFSKVVLVCPTSTDTYSEGEEKKDARTHPMYRLLSFPVIGTALVNFLTSKPRLDEYAREKLFFDKKQVSDGVISRLHVTSHQPGTTPALAARIANVLGGPWREAWSNLRVPACLAWGRNAGPQGFETAPEWLAMKPDADLEVFDNSLLCPHIEHAEEFNERIGKWLK